LHQDILAGCGESHVLWHWWGGFGLLSFCRQPPGQRGVTAIASREWWLGQTVVLSDRATEADVKVFVMSPPRPDFLQPWCPGEGVAEGLFDQGMHKNALDSVEPGGGPEQSRVLGCPQAGVQCLAVSAEHRQRLARFAFWRRELTGLWREPEPDISVQANLVTAVSIGCGAATRLPKIADVEHSQATLGDEPANILDILDQGGMTKVATPSTPHGLKTFPLWREWYCSLDTATRIRSNDA
jgi:hypothetical protein